LPGAAFGGFFATMAAAMLALVLVSGILWLSRGMAHHDSYVYSAAFSSYSARIVTAS
jgi:hypothetical protein